MMMIEEVEMRRVQSVDIHHTEDLTGLDSQKRTISFGKTKPTALPVNPIHIIKYSLALTSRVVPLTMSFMASAVRHGCTQKHGRSLMGWFCTIKLV